MSPLARRRRTLRATPAQRSGPCPAALRYYVHAGGRTQWARPVDDMEASGLLAQLLDHNVTNLEGERLAAAYAEIGGPQPVTLAAWSAPVEYAGPTGPSDRDKSEDRGCGCHASGASWRDTRGLGLLLLLACFPVFGRIRPNGRY